MSRERLFFGFQVLVALTLPLVLYVIAPPNAQLWGIGIAVIALVFAVRYGQWVWLVFAAVLVSLTPSVIDLGAASDPFTGGSLSMSLGALVSVTWLQPLDPEIPPAHRPRKHGLLVASAAILAIVGIGLISFAMFQNRSSDVAFEAAQQQARDLFLSAPSDVVGADDGTTPVLQVPAARLDGDIGPVVAALEFADKAGRPVVSAEPLYVREGVDARTLALGPGRYPTPATIGQSGNVAIAGHRTGYGYPFRNLDQLTIGDTVTATDVSGTRADYTVAYIEIVDPDAAWVLEEDPLRVNRPSLTLTTCDPPNTDDRRLVVIATLQAP